jgi:hypothetical protein
MKWKGNSGRMERRRMLWGNPEGRSLLRRPRRRWVDNVKMDLTETGWDGTDLIDLAQDRGQWRDIVNTVLNLRSPIQYQDAQLNNWQFLKKGSVP